MKVDSKEVGKFEIPNSFSGITFTFSKFSRMYYLKVFLKFLKNFTRILFEILLDF